MTGNYLNSHSISRFVLLFVAIGFCAETCCAQDSKSGEKKQATKSAKNKKIECKLPEIRQELLRRQEVDQKARRAMQKMPPNFNYLDDEKKAEWKDVIARVMKVDTENRKWLKPLIEEHGWLGKTLVGRDGAFAAWLLVQHADTDPKFQKKCLALMTKMEKGEVSATNLGYLTDRVLAAEGKPQRYGTQVEIVDGKPQLKNVEDPDNLDKRRAEIGLGPIEDYLKMFRSAIKKGK